MVYAEVSLGFETEEQVELFLGVLDVGHLHSTKRALILAARAHRAYWRQGGTRLGVLPDFFIAP